MTPSYPIYLTLLTNGKITLRGLVKLGNAKIYSVVELANDRANNLLISTYENTDEILDYAFQLEEVDHGLGRLKLKKAADHSGISAEHLKYGGHLLRLWLVQILNAMVEFESIPESLNLATLTPVYKGGGKDPLERGSYRGISVTPVISKLFKILILMMLEPHLQDLGIPHPNQTGYQKHTSCTDAIFSTAEMMSHYLEKGENMYLCCYDLHKAFDSVEYGVLLCRLYGMGINAKCWRLIRAWYSAPKCQVQLNDQFTLQRGVRQGSVLSPILFLLVMDPLLREMESLGLGASFAGLYLGASAHADDVRTVTSSLLCLRQQVDLVQNFASRNGLMLNIQKCKVMMASSISSAGRVLCSIDSTELVAKTSLKCFGFWWSWNLSAKVAIDESIKSQDVLSLCTAPRCFRES